MQKPVEYIVRVYDGSEVLEYEYWNYEQANSHLEWELSKCNCASLFAYYWNGTTSREEFIK